MHGNAPPCYKAVAERPPLGGTKCAHTSLPSSRPHVSFSPRLRRSRTGAQRPRAQVAPAQVSNALGETVGAGEKSGTATCTWVADKPIHQIVTLMYLLPGDWNSRKTRECPESPRVLWSGVGDDAIAETLGNLTTLFVKKGNTTFMVRVYGVPAGAKQLAIETPIRAGRRSEALSVASLPWAVDGNPVSQGFAIGFGGRNRLNLSFFPG